MSERRAELLLALTTVFWSGTFVFTKIALQDCDPLYFVTLRFLLATAVSAALWLRHVRHIKWSTLRDGMILGALYGAGFFFQTWGLQFTTISKSAFITGMVVIFLPGADWLIRRTKATGIHITAVAIATAGLILLTHPDIDNINNGDALTLCGSVLWSLYISFLDKSSTRHQDEKNFTGNAVVIQFATTFLIGVIVQSVLRVSSADNHLVYPGSLTANFTTSLIIALLYTALLGSMASTFIQTKVQRYVAPVKAGIIFTLEPIFASGIAYFSHHERFTTLELCGAALMISAIIFADTAKGLLQRFGRKPPESFSRTHG